jgi:hypothetical protein
MSVESKLKAACSRSCSDVSGASRAVITGGEIVNPPVLRVKRRTEKHSRMPQAPGCVADDHAIPMQATS